MSTPECSVSHGLNGNLPITKSEQSIVLDLGYVVRLMTGMPPVSEVSLTKTIPPLSLCQPTIHFHEFESRYSEQVSFPTAGRPA